MPKSTMGCQTLGTSGKSTDVAIPGISTALDHGEQRHRSKRPEVLEFAERRDDLQVGRSRDGAFHASSGRE